MTESASRLREAYDGGAANWASGPAAIYRRMADALIASVRVPLAGRRVLDIGAGTGATTAALLSAGAHVVGTDLFFAMLRVDREQRPPAVNADAASMPFAPESFDASAFAFVLSHLDAPRDALVEAARVTRCGGAVLSVGYDARWSFAAKEVIEATLMTFGFERPEWYDRMKRVTEPLSAFPDRLAALAGAAGLVDIVVHEVSADVKVRTAEAIVAWRLSMPMYEPFVEGLDDATRARLRHALREAVGPAPGPLVPGLLVLDARVG